MRAIAVAGLVVDEVASERDAWIARRRGRCTIYDVDQARMVQRFCAQPSGHGGPHALTDVLTQLALARWSLRP